MASTHCALNSNSVFWLLGSVKVFLEVYAGRSPKSANTEIKRVRIPNKQNQLACPSRRMIWPRERMTCSGFHAHPYVPFGQIRKGNLAHVPGAFPQLFFGKGNVDASFRHGNGTAVRPHLSCPKDPET